MRTILKFSCMFLVPYLCNVEVHSKPEPEDLSEVGLLKVMVNHLQQRDAAFEKELKTKDQVRLQSSKLIKASVLSVLLLYSYKLKYEYIL